MTDQRPWLKNYPPGVPVNIDPDKYNMLIELIDESLKKYSKLPGFACMGKAITFGEIDKMADSFGAYLQARGLVAGDRIALMMPNILQYPIALIGSLRAGLVIVNTNPLYTPREMEHQFNDSGAKAILIAENFAANLESIIDKTPIKVVITASIGGMLGMMKGSLVNFVVRTVKKAVPKYSIKNVVKFNDALKQGKKFELQRHVGSQNDTIVLQYTGGTTGVSKGAMLSNRNLVGNLLQFRAMALPYLDEGVETNLCPLPLYHVFAFVTNMLFGIYHGMLTVLVTNPRDLSTITAAFKKHPISMMTGVNTLYNALLNDKDFLELDFSKLKVVGAGGMALQKAVAVAWQEKVGTYLAEGYGLTETSPVASFNPIKQGKLGTIGIPVPSTDMRIVLEDGTVAGVDQVGEIQVSGPQVMKGYYNRPEATANVIKDGWLCTGDMGLMMENGYFRIVDRKKDMILVSGFNVYPNEIEDVLALHPKVLEVAAIGKPSDKSGEVVCVFVVKKDKSLTEDEVIQYARENLTGYKVPKDVNFVEELPKSNVGKILRRELREKYND